MDKKKKKKKKERKTKRQIKAPRSGVLSKMALLGEIASICKTVEE